jgi:hypothetical protein
MPTLILPSGRVDGHLAQRGHETTGLATRGTDGSNPPPSTGESTANLSFRVGIASMTVGCEEIRRARHRHVTVGTYYKRAVRRLAQEATMPAPRDRLADVALQYEKLAEGAEAGYHDPE